MRWKFELDVQSNDLKTQNELNFLFEVTTRYLQEKGIKVLSGAAIIVDENISPDVDEQETVKINPEDLPKEEDYGPQQ